MVQMRVRLKFGEHEFEAEGPSDDVHAGFAAFRQLIQPAPVADAPVDSASGDGKASEAAIALATEPVALPPPPITSLMRLEGRIVSLIKAPRSVDEGILLALLGQKLLRNNERVMGGEIINGIRRSGLPVHRVDYRTHKLVHAGHVVAIGRGRAARYRLTAKGTASAEALARTALD